MRTLLVSALALGAMTSVALAEEPTKPTPFQAEPAELANVQTGPVELTDAQMDNITAGSHLGGTLIDIGPTEIDVDVNATVCAVQLADQITCQTQG